MSDKITITLPDQSRKEADKGTTVYDIAGLIGKGLQKAALGAVVDGVTSDLSAENEDAQLSIITFISEGEGIILAFGLTPYGSGCKEALSGRKTGNRPGN